MSSTGPIDTQAVESAITEPLLAQPSPEPSNLYDDSALDQKSREIRLLHLSPRIRSRALDGSLQVVSLSSNPHYEALSYTWGATTKGHYIRLNGRHRLSTTDNLYNALRRLRHHTKIRILWVDRICINQENEVERGHQVSFMGEIFKAADNVCIWLGDISRPSLLQWLLSWATLGTSRATHWFFQHMWGKDSSKLTVRCTMPVIRWWFRLHGQSLLAALQDTNRQWHSRAWVYPELYHAQRVIWCFGRFQIELSGKHFEAFVTEAGRIANEGGGNEVQQLSKALQSMTMLQSLRKLPPEVDPPDPRKSLERTLLSTAHMLASDPRDKVYALLSVITAEEAELIKPVYSDSNSVADVFAQATYVSILGVAHSALLGYRGADFSVLNWITRFRPKMQGLPTWAVDFTEDRNDSCDDLYDAFANYDLPKLFPLSDQTDPVTEAKPRLGANGMHLHLTGALWDRIAFTAPIWETDYRHFDQFEGLPIPVEAIMQTVRQGEEMYTAYGNVVRRQIHDRLVSAGDDLKAALVQYSSLSTAHARYPGRRHFGELEVLFNWWIEHMALFTYRADQTANHLDPWTVYSRLVRYMRGMPAVSNKVSIFTTNGGFLGLAPSLLKVGDVLALANPSYGPLILKPRPDGLFEYHYTAFVAETWDLGQFWLDNSIEMTEIVLC